jgi:hypothetical protein
MFGELGYDLLKLNILEQYRWALVFKCLLKNSKLRLSNLALCAQLILIAALLTKSSLKKKNNNLFVKVTSKSSLTLQSERPKYFSKQRVPRYFRLIVIEDILRFYNTL